MHKLDKEVEDIIQHFGVMGMRWGVRKAERGSTKLDKHSAVKKHGKSPITEGRRIKAQLDYKHVDAKTGEYTHQGKGAKTLRILENTFEIAAATTAAAVLITMSGT